MIKSFVTTICVLFIVSTCMINAFAAPNNDYIPSSKEFLSKVCSEINKSLPMMISRDTQWTTTYALDKEIIYVYDFTDYSSTDKESPLLVKAMAPEMEKFAC